MLDLHTVAVCNTTNQSNTWGQGNKTRKESLEILDENTLTDRFHFNYRAILLEWISDNLQRTIT